ncbi:MAG: hypothetical protein EXS59_00550 [Candidatus Taylorbacteria bacterium]|nr:hypothetical protein [Candidatus Taylorbacteria bacterium]
MKSDDLPNFQKKEEQDDPMKALEERLYSRENNFSDVISSQSRLKKHDLGIRKNWGNEAPGIKRVFQDNTSHMPFLKKLFIFSVIFFLVSVSVAGYVFFVGGNVISSSNVDISITGPVSVAGGEIIPLEIRVTNQNNADLEAADLVIDYPEGTRQAEDMTVILKRYREDLGTIIKGGSVTKKVQAVLFGQEGDVKDLNISVEYRVKGSNAILPKKKVYSVALSSSPVTMTVTSVKELNANQEAEFTVTVVSNASAVIQKLSLTADYPFGFTFSGSDPKPSWSNSYWRLGDLKPGVKRTVKVRGSIVGQDNEDRVFKFSVGTESSTNDSAIGTNFLTATQIIAIKKPFIGTTLALDGNTDEIYTVRAGKTLRADLGLSNNIGAKMTDIKVAVKITGSIFDQSSVSLSNGFYRSFDKTIVWDQTLKSQLAVLNPDDQVDLSFSLGILPEPELRFISSPEMTLAVTVSGKRLSEAGLSQEVSSSVVRKIRVPSSLGISTRSLYYSGPFVNTGPIPPKADNDTSYTIVWSLTNGSTDLSNVKVTATLPSYVKWLAVTAPSSEKILYNPVGGQVVWDVGDLSSGTGFSGSPKEVSFQVSLTPSINQIRSSPVLVTEATAKGEDNFAGQTVTTISKEALTTELSTDISWKPGQGGVVK